MSKQTSPLKRAMQLYRAYKTTTPEYQALARQLGYESSGDLNARFSRELSQRAFGPWTK
jgi:hypothetical protein